VPPKKVLICSPSHTIHGGVETIIDDLCRELPARGWKPLVALGKGSRFNDVEAYSRAHADLPAVEIDGTKGTRPGRLEALAKLVEEYQPGIVISARIFDAYEAVSRLKQQRRAPRLAVMVRGYEPHYLFDARLYKDNIDLCVVDGNLLATACLNWAGLNPDRVVSIPGGIRAPKVPVHPRTAGNTLRIGYVGRLAQSDKRALDIVPFVRSLDEMGLAYSLSIVGEGPEEAELRERLQSQVLDGLVSFSGWKDNDELYESVYPGLDCFVNFSPAEGVTISGREAMVHGVVPVMSRFIGLKTEGQYVHDLNSLTFPVGDVEAAAANVVRLASEPGLLRRLSENAARSQTGKYTFAGAMDAWAEALDRCLEQPPMIGPVPKLNLSADGRLTRMGFSPRTAQRLRDSLRRQYVHDDPGSEWPNGSGLMTPGAAAEIMRFASDYENGCDGSSGGIVIETEGRRHCL
jgi:glycosyltransferase involved in cell wall biosynthesis